MLREAEKRGSRGDFTNNIEKRIRIEERQEDKIEKGCRTWENRKLRGDKISRNVKVGEKLGEQDNGGERLRGWLKTYGIKQTQVKEIRGAEEHIERLSQARNKKEEEVQTGKSSVKILKGGYTFTFRKYYDEEKIRRGAEKIQETGEILKREREKAANVAAKVAEGEETNKG